MPSSESDTSVTASNQKPRMIRSVVSKVNKDAEWTTHDEVGDDSDYDSDYDKENQERDWRKRQTIQSKDNNDKYMEYHGSNNDESDDHRRREDWANERSNKRRRERPKEKNRSDEDNSDYERRRKQRKERRRESPVKESRHAEDRNEPEKSPPPQDKTETKKKTMEDILTKAGGAYIPPSKLRQMQEGITDKTSAVYQRMAWEALKKSINGLVNKVNVSNIGHIVEELLQENVIRGRGLVCQSIMRAQVASPTFTNVYAALVSIINTKFPKIGELLLRRLIIQFRRSFKRNDKSVCINTVKFIGHLVNQQVAHELISLEVLTLLLQNPTGDSVEVAISFLKEIGLKLTDISPRGINAVFESLRRILHDSSTEKRVQYMIEVVFAIRKDGFKDYPSVQEGLDLVEEEDQITHILRIDDKGTSEDLLNVFKHDPEYEVTEEKYKQIKNDILGGDDSEDDSEKGSDEESDGEDDEEDDENQQQTKEGEAMEIIDKTETNLVALRRLIYLTIQSSLDYEECAHKMMKLNIKPGQEHEFCFMVLECCTQQRSYEKFFGLLGQRFCLLRKEFMAEYVVIFREQYDNCHQLETNKLRNTAKFFGHLLHSDAISWTVMECIRLNEDDTTSSSRIFIKVLFQDLAEYIGVQKLRQRLNDPIVAPYLEGVFPRDNPRDTRFSINFFTAIGLGGLTEDLRAHLKTMPKVSVLAAQQQQEAAAAEASSSSSSSSSDSSSSSSSSDDSDSSDEQSKRRKKRENGRDRSSNERPKDNKASSKDSKRSNQRERSKDERKAKDRLSFEERQRPNDRKSPDEKRGGKDRRSPEERRTGRGRQSPEKRQHPKDRQNLEERQAGRERRSPEERQRPEDRQSSEERRGKRDRRSPKERQRTKDRRSPEERRGVREERRSPEERQRFKDGRSPEERRQRRFPEERRRLSEELNGDKQHSERSGKRRSNRERK